LYIQHNGTQLRTQYNHHHLKHQPNLENPTPTPLQQIHNWIQLQDYINKNITINIRLKENNELEDAVQHLTSNTRSRVDIHIGEKKRQSRKPTT